MSNFMGFDFHKEVDDEMAEAFDSTHSKKDLENAKRELNTTYDMSLDNLLDAFFQLAKDEDSAVGMSVHKAPTGMLALPAVIMEVWRKAVEMKGENK